MSEAERGKLAVSSAAELRSDGVALDGEPAGRAWSEDALADLTAGVLPPSVTCQSAFVSRGTLPPGYEFTTIRTAQARFGPAFWAPPATAIPTPGDVADLPHTATLRVGADWLDSLLRPAAAHADVIAAASREALDHAYSPSKWTNRPLSADEVIADHCATLRNGSEAARAAVAAAGGRVERDVVYAEPRHPPGGSGDGQVLDVLLPAGPAQPRALLVYLHGGYWTALSKDDSAWMAPVLTGRGYGVACVGYSLCPSVTLPTIVSQCARALAHLSRRFSCPLVLCGHSAGGHLAACLLDRATQGAHDVRHGAVRGACLISGVFDLLPISGMYCNDWLRLGAEGGDAAAVSPLAHMPAAAPPPDVPVLVAVGEYDPPEFRRQSVVFFGALAGAGANASLLLLPDRDHFTAAECLADSDSDLTRALLAMLQAATG